MSNDICLYCKQRPKAKYYTFCSTHCSNKVTDEAPHLIRVPPNHVLFKSVLSQFLKGWHHGSHPIIRSITLITWDRRAKKRFDDYRFGIEKRERYVFKGKAPGNEVDRFRGLDRYCTIGEAGNRKLCNHPSCRVCEAISEGFGPHLRSKRKFLPADDYAHSHHPHAVYKAMLLCRTVLGRSFIVSKDMPKLSQPPPGFDSVCAATGPLSSFGSDESVVYDERAILPAYLIVYG
ncbi:hypothetical protein PRK78_007052 [Emydomyces testavorans]|uniref:PARP catalytic domain-containing protein n=1 Tax=Emydomyces testavorans TaxID=2070801 RepID=A0AAF0DMI7_9EURO|nr:hypothetical protein PRK78_007052 [Emydomyces testavorans]